MEVSVDINDVEKFITSDKFTEFLLNNTTDFATAAFVLQSLLEAVDVAKEELSKGE
jgi:hypothetical protein